MSPIDFAAGASKKDVAEVGSSIISSIERKINLSALVGMIAASLIGFAGIGIELWLRADFGYVLIALGVLGFSVGAALRYG